MERRGHSEREDRSMACSRSFVASPNVEPHSLIRRWLLEFWYWGGGDNGVVAITLENQVRHDTQYKRHVASMILERSLIR